MHLLVIDTNIFISAILGNSFPRQIIYQLVLPGKVELIVSPEVVEEYIELFSHSKFTKYPHFRTTAFDLVNELGAIVKNIIPKKQFTILSDKDDNKFLDLAISGRADFLITGNTKHFPLGKFRDTEIISPKEYWNKYWN